MSFQRQSGWGHPVGVRAAADWTNCPALTPFPAGVASVNCDGATCMQICEAGKVAMGRRRIKCRWKRKQGFFWKRALSECQGCTPENPTSNDANLTMNCAINTKGFNVCLATCSNGGKILGGKKLKLKCKCPRSSNGTRTCGWIGRKAIWDATQLSALTCEGGSSSGSTGSTGGSGSGSAAGATHCATGSTIITSAGVTCSDGSTPVAGSGSATSAPATTAAATTAAATTAAATTAAATTAAATTAAATTAAATTAAATTAAATTAAATTAAATTAPAAAGTVAAAASCCDTITWTDAGGVVRTFTKGTQVNEGYPVYENAADSQFMWWMWHDAVGHWVINGTPGAHGADVLKSTFALDTCPDAAAAWEDGTATAAGSTFTCGAPAATRQKIIALHGGGGSSASLQAQQGMQDLVAALPDFDFIFADTPEAGGVWMLDPPGGNKDPTTDPNWAANSIAYLDQLVNDNAPVYGLLGYSQGSAFIPVYLSQKTTTNTFDRVMLYCGYVPETHTGLVQQIDAVAPFSIPAMVFSGELDTGFGPLAPAQAAKFSNPTSIHSQLTGHELPDSGDDTFQSTVDFINAGVTNAGK